jgi:hypothetical protein
MIVSKIVLGCAMASTFRYDFYDVDGAGQDKLTTVALTRFAPACASAAATRARVSGATSASITPPQPAPESLAPNAPAACAAPTSASSSGDETPIC